MSNNLEIRQKIDAICNQFEDNWSETSSPDFESILNQVDPEMREPLLRALLEVDVELRTKAGLRILVDNYQQFGDEAVAIVQALIKAIPSAVSSPDVYKTIVQETSAPIQSTSKQIGPYKLLQQIGEGGMGTVWMAEQEKPLRRRVALKLIKAGVDNKQVVARFEAERQALAMMDHQNIAKVLDAGTTESGQPYFVMELVQGIPFTKYCDQNRLSINERLELFIPVCKAIQHAHQKGIIHRDIKPSNVLICLYDGKPVPKVIDFGLAKALQHQSRLTDKTMFTEFGQVVGTLQYMSPEQAEMNQLDIDTRTDVYSLGVMLYELLTGSTPIEQDSLKNIAILKVLETIREKDPPRPSDRLSSSTNKAITGISGQRRIDANKLKNILRGELDWIVMKALEKDRTRRYETANGFADDIQHFLSNEIVNARPPAIGYRFKKFVKKNRVLVMSTGLVIAALLTGIGMSTWFAFQAESARIDAVAARNEAEKISDLSKYFLSLARWDSGRVSEAAALLEEIQPKHRNFEWYLANKEFMGSYLTLKCDSEVTGLSVSPGGEMLVSSIKDNQYPPGGNTITIWNLTTGIPTAVELIGEYASPNSLTFSSNGQQLFSSGTSQKFFEGKFVRTITTRAWDPHYGREVGLVNCTIPGDINATRESTNGELIAICCGDLGVTSSLGGVVQEAGEGSLTILDAKSGKVLHKIFRKEGFADCQFSANGDTLLCVQYGDISLFDSLLGNEIWSRKINSPLFTKVYFHPDGKMAAAVSSLGIELFNLVDGELIRKFDISNNSQARGFSFTPSGSQFVTSYGDTIKLWNLNTGKLVREFKGHKDEITSVCVTPDGSKLISGSKDQTIKIWEVDPQVGISLSDRNLELSFSPDCKQIVVVEAGPGMGQASRWELATRKKLAEPIRFESWDSPATVTREFNFTNGRFPLTKSADGRIFAWQLNINDKPVIQIWDMATGQCIQTLTGTVANGKVFCLSPDGGHLAVTLGEENTVSVLHTKTGTSLFTSEKRKSRVYSVCYSPDGHQIALGNEHGSIELIDAKTGKHLSELSLSSAGGIDIGNDNGQTVKLIRFSSDGGLLFAGTTSGAIIIFKTKTGEQFQTIDAHTAVSDSISSGIVSIAISPDGSRFASGGTYEFKLWETETGQELRSFGRGGAISNLEFSSDGKILAIGHAFGSKIEIIDINPVSDEEVRRKAIVNPEFHKLAAVAAEADNEWYAAAFHRAWIMKCDPEQADAFDQLHEAHEKLAAEYAELGKELAPLLHPVVIEMLKLPRGNKLPAE